MKSWTIPFTVAATLASAGVVRADQCQRVDGNTAMRAMQLLHDHPLIVSYCEPCNDRAPSEQRPADFVHTERDVTGAYQVVVDRREIDLAYTYVMTGWDRWENLAVLTGCPASGVSPTLALLTPPPPAPAPVAMHEPPPPPTTYVIRQDRSVSFWALLGTCTATSAACTLGLFLLLRRRRLAMQPRAIRLIDRRDS
jgi:hypothetical protein